MQALIDRCCSYFPLRIRQICHENRRPTRQDSLDEVQSLAHMCGMPAVAVAWWTRTYTEAFPFSVTVSTPRTASPAPRIQVPEPALEVTIASSSRQRRSVRYRGTPLPVSTLVQDRPPAQEYDSIPDLQRPPGPSTTTAGNHRPHRTPSAALGAAPPERPAAAARDAKMSLLRVCNNPTVSCPINVVQQLHKVIPGVGPTLLKHAGALAQARCYVTDEPGWEDAILLLVPLPPVLQSSIDDLPLATSNPRWDPEARHRQELIQRADKAEDVGAAYLECMVAYDHPISLNPTFVPGRRDLLQWFRLLADSGLVPSFVRLLDRPGRQGVTEVTVECPFTACSRDILYRWRDKIWAHIARCHLGQDPFQCCYCIRCFANNTFGCQAYKVHLLIDHPDKAVTLAVIQAENRPAGRKLHPVPWPGQADAWIKLLYMKWAVRDICEHQAAPLNNLVASRLHKVVHHFRETNFAAEKPTDPPTSLERLRALLGDRPVWDLTQVAHTKSEFTGAGGGRKSA